jgi:hypothetical protein
MERRRMRRMEADRPTTDEWVVRESMWLFFVSFAAAVGRCGPWAAVLWLVAGGAIERVVLRLGAGASRPEF